MAETARCQDLQLFFDRELDPVRVKAFQEHLADCDRCAAELEGLMQEAAITGRGRR